MNTKWTNKITKEELRGITHQKSIENQIKKKKENGIGLDTHYTKKQEQ